jgi:hypothetical protein
MGTGHDEQLSPLQSPLLANRSGATVAHGFFTRNGGVSTGIYRGLNVGTGSKDRPENVAENRERVAAWFGSGLEKLATVYQCHSPDVVTIAADWDGTRSDADALVTDVPGMVLGVLAADCGPVLFADPGARIIGAAHAGWKGAFTGVLENTIAAMERLGASRQNIIASLGPSISRLSYEVGPDYVARFVATDAANERYFSPSANAGHSMFDLPSYTIDRLRLAGVTAENLDICTYADEDRFFSYRRTTHRAEPDYGRQISAIMLREN